MKTIYISFLLLFVSTLSFSQWTTLSSGTNYDLNSVYFVDINNGYSVGSSGTILKTTDAGNSWTILSSGTTLDLNSVYFVDVNNGYSVGSSGIILKTTDAGNKWTTLTSGETKDLYSVYFTNVNNGYAVGDQGKIYKTINAGLKWEKNSNKSSYKLRAINFTDSTTGFVVGEFGTILKTNDAGETWNMLPYKSADLLFSFFFTDTKTCYLVGHSGKIKKSTDAGETWVKSSSETKKDLYAVCFTDNNNGYSVGSSGTILNTIDAGSTWKTMSSGVTNDLYSIGSSGTILKTDMSSGITNDLYSICFTSAGVYAVGSKGLILTNIITTDNEANKTSLNGITNDTTSSNCDNIILKNGNEISAKILEIGINEIKYKKCDYLTGPTIAVEKSGIFMIKYSNGTKELFNDKNNNEPTATNDLCFNGQYDAKKLYKRSMAGTLVPTLIFSPIGLIIAISSSGPPQEKHIKTNHPEMLKSIKYKDCYLEEAKHIKRREVWGGFWLGLAINLAVEISLYSLYSL